MGMRKKSTRSAAAPVLLGVAIALGAGAVVGFSSADKPPAVQHIAPWINADGTVDESKAPAVVPVYGPDGKILVRDGKQMGVRVADLERIEPVAPAGAAQRKATTAAPTDVTPTDVTPAVVTLESVLVPLK